MGHELYISLGGKILFSESVINSLPITLSKADKTYDEKISTFDLECYRDDNNVFRPYACGYSLWNGTEKLFYITDFDSFESMISNCLHELIRSNPGTVYVHNLSKFDNFFITPILYNKDNGFIAKSQFKDNNILSITISTPITDAPKTKGRKNNTMVFKDSLLLLPGSLKKMGSSYNLNIQKGFFPYSFPNATNLNYIGPKPEFKHYEDISLLEYESIPSDN